MTTDPTKFTQIYRSRKSIARTAWSTTYRTGQYQKIICDICNHGLQVHETFCKEAHQVVCSKCWDSNFGGKE